MRDHDLRTSAVFFCLGLFVAFYSLQYGLGRFSSPKSGFWPFLIGLSLCGFSGATFVRAFLDKSKTKEQLWGKIKYWRLVFTTVSLIAYAFLLSGIGYLTSSFLLLLFNLRYLGLQSWRKSALVAVFATVISYILFKSMDTDLPKGFLGF